MAKNNETLYLAIGALVVGYFVFKKGGVLNSAPATSNTLSNAGAAALAAGPAQIPMASYTSGIATEQPTEDVINTITPTIDPTGMQLSMG
jgi:hypothetical protein